MIFRRLQIKGAGKKKKRASEKKASDGGNDQCGNPNERKNVSKDYLIGVDQEYVVELNESNFDELVVNSKDMWMVEFFTHWCGHCQQLAPHWGMAAHELNGVVKLGKVECDTNRKLADKYSIPSYPTIKYFPPNDKANPEDYDGQRTADYIVTSATEKLKEYTTDFEITEVQSDEQLKSVCDKKKTICFIAVVDNVTQLNVLKPVLKKFSTRRIAFLYFLTGTQKALETQFKVKGPTAVAVKFDKKSFYVMGGDFTEKTAMDFANGIQKEKFFFLPFSTFPEIESS
jgi:protein disulfide-isomerase A6